MSEKKRNSGLGRGLSDLLGDGATASEDISELDKVKQHKIVSIELLSPSPYQPRRSFDQESLNNLVDSIKEKGVLQPLLVRRDPNDNSRYEIIAGERRFRASQLAGLIELPVIVKEMNNQEVLEVALIENIQRQDLNAIEEAEGYNRLIEEFNHTQEELGRIVGKSRSHVANTMRLLNLPDKVKDFVIEGKLSAGHARALITAKDPEGLAEKIINKGLNVRQVEKLAHSEDKKKEKVSVNTEEKQDDAKALAEEVERMIGTKVSIKFKNNGGEMLIYFDSLSALDVLLKRITQEGMLEPSLNSHNETINEEENLDQSEENIESHEIIETDIEQVNSTSDENNNEEIVNNIEIVEHQEEEVSQKGMTKEEVEKLLQSTIDDGNPNFAGLKDDIVTDDDDLVSEKENFDISLKEDEIIFEEEK